MIAYTYLVLAILTNVVGHVMFKYGATSGAPSQIGAYIAPYTIMGFAAYGLSAFAYIAALRTMPLTVAMPSMVIGYLFAALVAHFMFGEAFGGRQLAAFASIGLGMYLLHT